MTRILLLTALVGCEPMAASEGSMPPAAPSPAKILDAATVKPVVAVAEAPAATLDAATVKPVESAPPAPSAPPPPAATTASDDAALLAAALGQELPPMKDPPLPGAPPAGAPPARAPWKPGEAVGGWGVRLVSITSQANPPRAILGLPDGSEQVIEPGSMLTELRLVVTAIGQDAVQIARVEPDGDRVRIETQELAPLYRQGADRVP